MQRLKSFITFKKNGTKSNDSEILFFDKKREDQFKQKIIVKTFLCLILTNTLTYMACQKNSESIPDLNSPNMTILSIPLENYVPSDYGNNEVTLLGPHNEILATNAIIEAKEERIIDIEDKEVNFYTIKIKNEHIDKLVGMEDKIIRAYPKIIKPKTVAKNLGGPYEINF